jgi:hypothetical protein
MYLEEETMGNLPVGLVIAMIPGLLTLGACFWFYHGGLATDLSQLTAYGLPGGFTMIVVTLISSTDVHILNTGISWLLTWMASIGASVAVAGHYIAKDPDPLSQKYGWLFMKRGGLTGVILACTAALVHVFN